MWDQLVKTVELVHPYEVPCIMRMEVAANAGYEDWVRRQVG